MEKIIHQGRNITRFRKMLDVKQEALASLLGEDWTQKKVSLLEAKDVIEDDILKEVAKALKIPVDAIKNFDEDAAISIVANTFTDFKDNASGINNNLNCTFNPLDKLVELYERMLKEKDEQIAKLSNKK